jgi:hypothetical protein
MAKRRAKRKVSGAADYIVPLAVVGLGAAVLYKFGFFDLFSSGSGSGSGSGSPGLLSPGGALSPQSSPTVVQQSTLSLDDAVVAFIKAQPTATSPLLSTLYQTSPSGATIDQATATSLWSDLKTAKSGSGFLSLFVDRPDMSPILGQFQAVVQNAIDVSWVATLCQNETSQTLQDWLFNSFAGDNTGTSGQTGMQMLANFVYWAFTLPTD